MTDAWIDCTLCSARYAAGLSSCPACGAANPYAARRRRAGYAKAMMIAGVAVLAAVAIIVIAPGLLPLLDWQGKVPAISILPQLREEPKTVPRDELVDHALAVINKDRADFGLPPVKLSSNAAAQIHAEDVFQNKQISHWLSNGEKPYMTYSRYGGTGAMGQNVAIAGFTKEQYDECVSDRRYNCERIDPISTIDELEHEMMYNDTECCDDGHRNNILNPYRTDVSIGIVYDKYFLALVQNFENNYGLSIAASSSSVVVSGRLQEGEIDHLQIEYDPLPTPGQYEQNKHSLSYSPGQLAGVVAKPLPPGFFYEQPAGYRLIVASEWQVSADSIRISFDMARLVGQDGVYTVTVIAKSKETGDSFEAAAYSVTVDNRSQD